MHSPTRPIPFTVIVSLLGALTLLTHPGCDTIVVNATREPRPLSYVGQIEIGEPVKEDGQVLIPLAYEGGEWTRNSAIVPVWVDGTVKGNEIDMTVTTSVATDGARRGYQLVLPGDVAGKYSVYYRDPDGSRHEIGSVEIIEGRP